MNYSFKYKSIYFVLEALEHFSINWQLESLLGLLLALLLVHLSAHTYKSPGHTAKLTCTNLTLSKTGSYD